MDNKRVLIALLLSGVILFLYPVVMQRFYPQAVKKAEKTAEAVKQGEGAAPEKAVSAPRAGEGATYPGKGPGAKAAAFAPKEEITTVETPLFKAVFTGEGGGVKSWEIKKYTTAKGTEARAVNLAGAILKEPAFKTGVSSEGLTKTAQMRPSKNEIVLKGSETAELVFTGSAGPLRIEKRYVFSADSYTVNTEVNLQNPAAARFKGSLVESLASPFTGKEEGGYHAGPLIKARDKLLRQKEEKEPRKSGSGKVGWIGLENKYFLTALIPKTEKPLDWETEVSSNMLSKATVKASFEIKPGEKAVYSYDLFMGPKEYDLLLKHKAGLEEAIEFGYFDFMAKPLLVVLNFFERYLKNYGLAIILLTVIIKVIFYPLTKHSMKSMKEMQKVQPQLAAIKEKYKDNKEKLNKETMELYKRYKINPLSGCLPMILQIPVFIALYEVLYVAIELRHAPFVLWITDLSSKDPYYVTPLLMGATMFVQQKMTPTSVDPMQSKIMLIMPAIFTFMFLNFPSGLVIYWLVNNVLSISQQYFINKATAA